MEIVDANIVLRYLLNDHETFSARSRSILENQSVYIPFEVCAEVVYVLEKVYDVPRAKIVFALSNFLNYSNISTNDKAALVAALRIYHSKRIDFVDSILVAYNKKWKAKIHSFDKKLNKLCD